MNVQDTLFIIILKALYIHVYDQISLMCKWEVVECYVNIMCDVDGGADGKKLFFWREVWVLTELSFLPEGSVAKSLCTGWEGTVMIFSARLSVLEACRSWRDSRLHPITFSAQMICCRTLLSLTVAAVYLIVMEDVRTDSMMAV